MNKQWKSLRPEVHDTLAVTLVTREQEVRAETWKEAIETVFSCLVEEDIESPMNQLIANSSRNIGLFDAIKKLREAAARSAEAGKTTMTTVLAKLMAECPTCRGPLNACDCLPPLVVTRNGIPCADQQAAIEEFKTQCATPPVPAVPVERNAVNDRFTRRVVVEDATPAPTAEVETLRELLRDLAPAIQHYFPVTGLAIYNLKQRVTKAIESAPTADATCEWTFRTDAFNCVWNQTQCGVDDAAFGEEERFKFCPYCGGKIERDSTTVEEVMNQ